MTKYENAKMLKYDKMIVKWSYIPVVPRYFDNDMFRFSQNFQIRKQRIPN